MPVSRSPARIAALTKVAAIQHDVVWEDACPGGSALIDPMGVTVFGGGDPGAVLSAEVDPGAVRATGRNLPFPSRFGRITKIQHFATISLPGATHVYGDANADAAGNPWGSRRHVVAVRHRCTRCP